MCRRHDDFRSAASIVEIAMQLHVTSASEKVGGLSPSPKSGGPIPCPPCSDAYATDIVHCTTVYDIQRMLVEGVPLRMLWRHFCTCWATDSTLLLQCPIIGIGVVTCENFIVHLLAPTRWTSYVRLMLVRCFRSWVCSCAHRITQKVADFQGLLTAGRRRTDSQLLYAWFES